MIEIKIPKEVTKYEAKLVGPFTARQCVVLVIFVPIFGICFFALKQYMNSTTAAYICLPIGVLAWAFGWAKPYGMTFEKYMQSVFINSFIAPAVRVNKTENYYDLLSKKVKELTPEQLLIIDATLEGAPEEEVKTALKALRKQQKKVKKSKYKKSKKAYF